MNPITQHAHLARSQMPPGSGPHHRSRRIFSKPRGHTGRMRYLTNLEIVKERLAEGDKEGARQLLEEIKSGAKKALDIAK